MKHKIINLINRIPSDKILHFLVGYNLTSIVMLLALVGADAKWLAYLIALLITGVLDFGLAIYKEIIDPKPDNGDVWATMVGWLGAVAMTALILLCDN